MKKTQIYEATVLNLIESIRNSYLWPNIEDFQDEIANSSEDVNESIRLVLMARKVWKKHEKEIVNE